MRLLACGLVFALCASSSFAILPSQRDIDEAQPETSALLDGILARWDDDPAADLRGVCVLHDGIVVAERYYNGATADDLHDVRSAGKSVTALMMGLALEQGAIQSTEDTVERYWPESEGSAIGPVRLDDVLTMRSGLAAFDEDAASPGHEDRLDEASDPLAFILGVPKSDPPGSRYRYNSLTSSVAGIVIAKAVGRSMADFAKARLFGPMGIETWRWDADAAGFTKGQGNLFLRLRDFAALGEMVQQGGTYGGRRILSAAWITRALTPKVRIGDVDRYADRYGYYWYSKTYLVGDESMLVYFASGNGGNKIYVVPSRNLVIAITSSAYGKGYGQRRSEAILLAVLSQFAQVAPAEIDGTSSRH